MLRTEKHENIPAHLISTRTGARLRRAEPESYRPRGSPVVLTPLTRIPTGHPSFRSSYDGVFETQSTNTTRLSLLQREEYLNSNLYDEEDCHAHLCPSILVARLSQIIDSEGGTLQAKESINPELPRLSRPRTAQRANTMATALNRATGIEEVELLQKLIKHLVEQISPDECTNLEKKGLKLCYTVLLATSLQNGQQIDEIQGTSILRRVYDVLA